MAPRWDEILENTGGTALGSNFIIKFSPNCSLINSFYSQSNWKLRHYGQVRLTVAVRAQNRFSFAIIHFATSLPNNSGESARVSFLRALLLVNFFLIIIEYDCKGEGVLGEKPPYGWSSTISTEVVFFFMFSNLHLRFPPPLFSTRPIRASDLIRLVRLRAVGRGRGRAQHVVPTRARGHTWPIGRLKPVGTRDLWVYRSLEAPPPPPPPPHRRRIRRRIRRRHRSARARAGPLARVTDARERVPPPAS